MFKYLLSLTFAVSFASAATISTQATCDGVTTFGTFSAICFGQHSMAEASLGYFGVTVSTTGPASASALFDDDYLFTIFGGTGNGFFFPCISGSAAGAKAEIGFGAVRFGTPGDTHDFPVSNCRGNVILDGSPQPFTFAVPQIVEIQMTGSGSFGRPGGTDGGATLDGFLFFDASGNQVSTLPYALVSANLPEPSALYLLSIGLMLFVAVRIRAVSRLLGSQIF
jgi:hypothetical protein